MVLGLTREELDRYSRQLIFPKIGIDGQKRLKAGKVAVIGLGGLGSAAATYLACAGIGCIRLIDRDVVELNNLQRQILYDEHDAKRHTQKAVSAKERLEKLNSDITVEAACVDFNQKTARNLIKGMDIVVDGTDNLKARYMLNEVCVMERKPFVHGAALGDVGAVTMIVPGRTPCLNCIYPRGREHLIPQTCETAGVIGLVPGLIGILETMEVIKFLAGFGEQLTSRLLYVYPSSMTFDAVNIKSDPDCDVCSSLHQTQKKEAQSKL